ncbi:hypothetical protein RND71_020820 [Anisodus tanguticus]|uniref:Pentatricopeptide repeat-containing protein n=1 Tax=Anisodus tanguticus TaxID=243964 RepID=A0AAE1RVE9_9SOLA|nr:hypothetical protein RND71_020820 [Anisodus tanguticus]
MHQGSPTVGTALLDAYVKTGNTDEAAKVFEEIDERDIIAWSAMLSGYAQKGDIQGAVRVFRQLLKNGVRPDEFTFSSVINSCVTFMASVEQGKQFHGSAIKSGHSNALCVSSALVTMYAKRGNIEIANEIFKRQQDCRTGMLDIAMALIDKMPFPAGAIVWRSLLAASQVHRNLELGKRAAENLIPLQPHDSSAHVLLSNFYAATGDWQERAEVRKLMDVRKVKKETGYSWIEVKNKTYSFMAGDVSHPLSDNIYMKLDELSVRLKDEGHQPDTN